MPTIDINILAKPRYRPNIVIDKSTHPRDRRDIAIAVLQDALAKREFGSILGASSLKFGAQTSLSPL